MRILPARAHPNLVDSYRLKKLLSTRRELSVSGPIELLFYPIIAQRLGLLRDHRFRLDEASQESPFFSRRQMKWLAMGRSERGFSKPHVGSASLLVSSMGRKTILTMLESLVAQSKPFSEILIAWDGVATRKASQLERMIQRRFSHSVNFLYSPRRQGPGYHRNRLAEVAKSDALLFFDDDDLALPLLHESLLQAIQLLEADAVIPARTTFVGSVSNLKEDVVHFGADPICGFFCPKFMGDSCMIIRKQTFFDIGGFSEDIDEVEDTILHVKMALAKKRVIPFPEPLFLYRRSALSRSKKLDPSKTDKRILHLYHDRMPFLAYQDLKRLKEAGSLQLNAWSALYGIKPKFLEDDNHLI